MNDDPRTLRILFNKAIDDFSAQVTTTESQLSQAQADLADTKSKLAQAQTDLLTANSQLSAAQTQLNQLNSSVTQLTASAAAAVASQFVYAQAPGAPVVTSVSPASGNPAGGDTVTITGSGFTGVTAVSFGLTPAASFTFVSDTQITAVSPPGSGPVNVRVSTPLGSSVAPTA